MATEEQFAVSATGTPLKWLVNAPNPNVFPPPWDVVCMWHGGGWANGDKGQMNSLGHDLSTVGLVGLPCDYEKTQVMLPGPPPQSGPVRWPNQSPDCALAIAAARTCTGSVLFGKVSGKVGGFGGSAGATLGIDVGLRGTVDFDRADFVVALSANYDFSDQDSLDQYEGQGAWIAEILAYTNLADRTHVAELLAKSVLPLVPGSVNIPALYLSQSDGDAVGPPTSQMVQMVAALEAIGFANFTAAFCAGSEHSQGNWNAINHDTGHSVKDDAIAFMKAAFAAGTGGGGGGGGGGGDVITEGFRLVLTGGPYTLVGANTQGEYGKDVRSATITNLAPSSVETPVVMHSVLTPFNEFGDGVPATYDFTTPLGTTRKAIPFGAYHLLTAAGGAWYDDLPGQDSLAFPYVIGYRGRSGINNVQPDSPVGYDWTQFDAAFDIIKGVDKKLSLSIALGIATTDWWYDTGGPTEVAKIAIDLADITPQAYQPVFWDPAHLLKMQTFCNAFGAKYDSDTAISYVVVTGFMQGSQAFLSKTAADDAKWDAAATDFDYADKVEAYLAGGEAIIGYFMAAFPQTPLYFSSGIPFFDQTDGRAAANGITSWIRDSTNNRCGIMVTGSHATLPPHDPPIIATFYKGGQAIFSSADHNRFYGDVVPDPYPVAPQLVDDLFKEAGTEGRTFMETYTLDINDPVNEDVIIAGNLMFQSIVPNL